MTRSLSVRLALMFALASLIFVSAYGLLMRFSLHRSLQEQMQNELLFRSNLIEPWIRTRTNDESWQHLTEKLSDLAATEGVRVRYGFWANGESLYRGASDLPELGWLSLNDGIHKIKAPDGISCSLFLYVKSLPLAERQSTVRYVIVIDSTYYMGTLRHFTNTLIVITAFGLILVACAGFIIARIGLRPVKHLSEQTQHLIPGLDGQRLDTDKLPNELKDLASAFNGVLQRQEVAWLQLESFNADVAHELRTPLTNLIGQTQLGLSHDYNVDELKEMMESNLEELERMTSIVNDMLFLSHAQAGQHATQTSFVSLNEEHKTVDYIEPLLGDKNLEVKIEGDMELEIDRRLFHRALANLLSNAARYAELDSVIQVTITHDEQSASISVSNRGNPIPDAQLDRLFERFYRVDSARTSSNTHHGLGLAIVKAVALMHLGEVFARSEESVNTFGFTVARSFPSNQH